jgi:hypothetical protein
LQWKVFPGTPLRSAWSSRTENCSHPLQPFWIKPSMFHQLQHGLMFYPIKIFFKVQLKNDQLFLWFKTEVWTRKPRPDNLEWFLIW